MTPHAAILLVSLTLFSSALAAQPHCKKGIPCGNSCISASKTCRIGSPAPRPTSTPAPKPVERAAPAPTTLLAMPAAPSVAADTLLPWVVSATGATYYASACAGAVAIAPGSRMYYRIEENLKRLGMSRATPKQEACSRTEMQEHERRVAASGH